MIRISLLLAGVVGPLIYVAFALGGQWLAPGYDPAVRMVSELGLSDMPAATLFNTGLMVSGALTVLAALGLGLDAARRGAALSGALAGLAVAVFGASIGGGGLFPLPYERHLAWGAGFAVQRTADEVAAEGRADHPGALQVDQRPQGLRKVTVLQPPPVPFPFGS